MKKSNLFKNALIVAAAICAVACDGDEKEKDGSLLTPDDQQAKLEQVGKNMVNNVSVVPFEDAFEAVNGVIYVMANGGGTTPPMQLFNSLNELAERLEESDIQGVEELLFSDFVIDYSEFYGIYTYNNGEWAYKSDAHKLSLIVDNYALNISTSSSSSSAVGGVIPGSVMIEFLEGGKELFMASCSLHVSEEIFPVTSSAVVCVGPYEFSSGEKISNSEATINILLKNNKKTMVALAASVGGYDIQNGVIPEGGSAKINFLDELYLQAKVGSIVDIIEVDDQCTWPYDNDELKAQADILNEEIDFKWNFSDSFSKPAGYVRFEYDADDYDAVVYPVLVFSSDDSAYAFEDFFTESAFSSLIEKVENLIEDIEDSSFGDYAM